MSDQLELTLPDRDDLELRLERQWAKNAADQAAFWTDERLACSWAFGTIQIELTPWIGMKNYEQQALLNLWRTERDRAAMLRVPMRPAGYLEAMADHAYSIERERAESWAKVIQEDFKAGRPCSIKPAPDYEWVLNWAFQIALVPRECVPPAPEEPEDE